MSQNSTDCLFCKIASGDIPGDIVFEDDTLIAFNDIHPQAPVHILIVPKQHVSTLNELNDPNRDISVISDLTNRAIILAKESGIDDSGFRILMNCNREGGQTVYHLHMHLLGGRQLGALC